MQDGKYNNKLNKANFQMQWLRNWNCGQNPAPASGIFTLNSHVVLWFIKICFNKSYKSLKYTSSYEISGSCADE
jgi:hypothetical protein